MIDRCLPANEPMKFRQLGDTDLTVSEIGIPLRPLATNDYGHVTEQDTLNLLTRAFDLGFTYFDTADSYTQGYGERVLARAFRRSRHDIVISTKAGYDFYRPVIDPDERGKSQRWTSGFIRYACEQSLRRLDTDYIDLFQLHHPGPNEIEDDELFGLLDDLVQEGKTRYYGVTLDSKPESEEAGEGAIGLRNVSAVQVAFSLLEQQPARKLISRAQGGRTAVVACDPSASGVLEAEMRRTATAISAEGGDADDVQRKLTGKRTLEAALREFGGDVGTWAIKFPLASPVVGSDIAGGDHLRSSSGAGQHRGPGGRPQGIRRTGIRRLRR